MARPNREISPAVNATADNYLKTLPTAYQAIITTIRNQKAADTRPWPSSTLLDRSTLLTPATRARLLDAVAGLVDENLSGRSDMCQQFAELLHRALNHLGFPSRAVAGWAIYYGPTGQEIHRWKHAWVRIGDEVVDGNVDSLGENPLVPKTVSVAPYWGPVAQIPSDRRLREDRNATLPGDGDVDNIWWPDLKHLLENEVSL